jgi:hypothetical protein
VELTTDQKGSIAEAAISLAALRLGVGVFKPISEGERYDLVFDLRPRLVRVQCKWACHVGDVVSVSCYSNRRAREGLRRRLYSEEEIDAFAAYCSDIDRCYFLPLNVIGSRQQIHLRLNAARNNQHRGINWASDFEFAATIGTLGAVAQLGERRHGMPKARGSSPLGSIAQFTIPLPSVDRREDGRFT